MFIRGHWVSEIVILSVIKTIQCVIYSRVVIWFSSHMTESRMSLCCGQFVLCMTSINKIFSYKLSSSQKPLDRWLQRVQMLVHTNDDAAICLALFFTKCNKKWYVYSKQWGSICMFLFFLVAIFWTLLFDHTESRKFLMANNRPFSLKVLFSFMYICSTKFFLFFLSVNRCLNKSLSAVCPMFVIYFTEKEEDFCLSC